MYADIFVGHAAHELRRRDIWERAVRGGHRAFASIGSFGMPWRSEPGHANADATALRTATRSTLNRVQSWHSKHGGWVRRAALAISVSAATAGAVAASIAVKAYVDHPVGIWTKILAARTHSPLYDTEGRLAGSLGPLNGSLDVDEQRNYAFIPLRNSPPQLFTAALLQLEDRHFGEASWWRTWCGIDAPSLVGRWVTSAGTAGGSGLVQQLTKQLKAPEWGSEQYLLAKAARKFKEIGASCRVWSKFEGESGPAGVLRYYASIAPMWQGSGTLRGLEASAQVIFGVAPADLGDAEQLVLASSVKEPLRLLKPGDAAVDCRDVYPRVGNPSFSAEMASAKPARANQCRVLHRALSVAPKVLSGVRLDAAMAELGRMQREGIVPVNEFRPVAAKRLINLTSRTAAMLPSTVLTMATQELEDLQGFKYGDPIQLTVDAVAQRHLTDSMTAELGRVQMTPLGKKTLCIRLARSETTKPLTNHDCGEIVSDEFAEVFAMKINAATGAVRGVYATSPFVIDHRLSAGSLAKVVILAAAVGAGYAPDSLWCPRRVSDGTRQLRRVGPSPYGFTDEQCARGGQYLITLEQAIAESDNLVAAEVAKRMGEARLREALNDLGLAADEGPLWYALAFGTLGATPRELLAAGRSLFAVAYGIDASGSAPRVLENGVADDQLSASQPIARLMDTPGKCAALRRLLEAPVANEHGTLGFVRNAAVTAGKTGTTQSESRDRSGNRNAYAKLALTFQVEQQAVNLFVVAAPTPQIPLALHTVQGSLFSPAHRALLEPR